MDKTIGINDSTNVTGMKDLFNVEHIDTFKASTVEKQIIDDGKEQPISQEYVHDKFLSDIQAQFDQIKFNKGMDSQVNSSSMSFPPGIDLVNTPTSTESPELLNKDFADLFTTDFKEDLLDASEVLENDNYESSSNTRDHFSSSKDNDDYFIQIAEEDEKLRLLERIDLLREILKESRTNIDHIKEVNPQSRLEDIQFTLKLLDRKNNRTRHSEFAEDCILGLTYLAEDFFDGKREYFGHHPDLTGFHKTVSAKLPRLRHDTTEIAETIIESLGLGAIGRLVLELGPSAYTYSRQRKKKHTRHVVNAEEVERVKNEILNS